MTSHNRKCYECERNESGEGMKVKATGAKEVRVKRMREGNKVKSCWDEVVRLWGTGRG